MGAPRRARRAAPPSSSRRAAATPAARPAPGRGSSPTSTPRRWPCACSASSARAGAGGRRRAGGGLTDRRRRRPRAPAASGSAPRPAAAAPGRRRSSAAAGAAPAAELAERLAAALDGEVVATAVGALRPASRAGALDLPLDRERLADAARPAAAGRAARLPRHGDDRPRDGGRDRRVPHRPRLVGGRPLPAGPAAAARPRRRARRCSTQLGRHIPADAWLVTYNGRGFDWPLLVDALPDGAPRPRRSTPATSTCCPIVRRLFRHRMTDARLQTVGADAARPRSGTATSRAGRSRAATSGSCAAGRPSRSSTSSATTTRTSARWPGCSACSTTATRDVAARRTAPTGDLAGLARAFARAGATTRRSPASTRRSRATGLAPPTRPSRTRESRRYDLPAGPRARPAGPGGRGGRAVVVAPARADFGGRPRATGASPSAWRPAAAVGRPWDAAADRDRARPPAPPPRPLCRGGRGVDRARGRAGAGRDPSPGSSSRSCASIASAIVDGALEAADRASAAADRRRRLGRPEPLARGRPPARVARLRRRRARPARAAERLSSTGAVVAERHPRIRGLRRPALAGRGRAPDRTSRPSSAGPRPAR